MIDFNLASIFSNSLLDIILILISASACFYCALLSRRLKALNKLDVGVGASIVSLTEAIGKTHDAAREAQNSTQETVKTLRFLLEKSESMGPVLEASMTEVSRSLASIQAVKSEINKELKPELSEATQKAKNMAADLLKTVQALESYQAERFSAAAAIVSETAPEIKSADPEPAQTPSANLTLVTPQIKDVNLQVVNS